MAYIIPKQTAQTEFDTVLNLPVSVLVDILLLRSTNSNGFEFIEPEARSALIAVLKGE